jgi:hypothetical protein
MTVYTAVLMATTKTLAPLTRDVRSFRAYNPSL